MGQPMFCIPGDVIRTKSSVLSIFERGGELFVKKEGLKEGEKDIKSQVYMLSSLPKELSAHFPKLIEYEVNKRPLWYTMPYYDFPALRESLFFDQLPNNVIQSKLDEVVDFLFYKLYQWKIESAESDYVQRAYVDRLHDRLRILKACDPFFENALAAKEIIFEEKSLQQPSHIFQRILANEAIIKAIQPEFLHSIHGQLEFDHLLMNMDLRTHNAFVLLDPRGITHLADIGYDLAKIWQSVRTMVDLLKLDKYEMEFRIESDMLVFDSFKLLPFGRETVCQDIYSSLRERVEKFASDMNDPHLLLRSEFAEAVHLCSAAPYYYEGPYGLQRSLSFYLLGAVAFNQFAAKYL